MHLRILLSKRVRGLEEYEGGSIRHRCVETSNLWLAFPYECQRIIKLPGAGRGNRAILDAASAKMCPLAPHYYPHYQVMMNRLTWRTQKVGNMPLTIFYQCS